MFVKFFFNNLIELKKGTRFGFTPNHKNTFGVIESV